MEISIEEVSKSFGGIKALRDVSFTAADGRITALIGPNGAGKTTMFNCIAGFHNVDSGRVLLDGRPLTNLSPHRVLERGLARTFQLTKPFRGLTVIESVMVAGHWRSGQSFGRTILSLPSVRASERRLREEATATLDTLGIAHLATARAQELPYGQQRLVEIAKVLATGAHTLLLDEPAAGLHESEVDDLAAVVRLLKALGRTILMVEHNMAFTFSVAEYVAVLDFGQLIATGTPAEVSSNEVVLESYLGKEEHSA